MAGPLLKKLNLTSPAVIDIKMHDAPPKFRSVAEKELQLTRPGVTLNDNPQDLAKRARDAKLFAVVFAKQASKMKSVLQDLLRHSDDTNPTLWVMHPKQQPSDDEEDHILHSNGFDSICGELELERGKQVTVDDEWTATRLRSSKALRRNPKRATTYTTDCSSARKPSAARKRRKSSIVSTMDALMGNPCSVYCDNIDDSP
eukprot:m.32742 g.32742  ORF g.32742 m.32742 type:complete len:201 (-) comp14154_c0_seq1:313-915(-)